ncbi:hypothetical protein TIFTF001_002742 [Ficus carica]|uniref:Uncharacterized protein n=1 Tax=Ficus carica TaxID=3494 RepID=A0AA87ZD02_FICCA|nr:hypothetical protein TIFTF001_002742 [Ficus carica]
MSKISGTTPNVNAHARMYLHDYSADVYLQKEKHLEVIGIPVGCLPRALQCLMLPSDPGVQVTQWGRLPSASGGRSLLLMCAVTGFTSDVR